MNHSWTEDRVERLEPYLAAALDESMGDKARCAPTRQRVLQASMQRLVDTDGQFGFRPQTLLRALELAVVAVNVAHKLYEARRLLRSVMGAEYSARIVEYMRIIDGVSKDVGHIAAGIQVAKELMDQGHATSVTWALAATVELIEPDELTPKLS